MQKIFRAIDFAQKAHQGQFRKGTKVPYIVHPLGVMQTILENGGSEDVAVAGVLHDVVEDTPFSITDVEAAFGSRVAELVEAASEPNKEASWEERKQHTIEFLQKVDDADILLLVVSDKLNNLQSMMNDFGKEGAAFWNRFNRGVEDQRRYYCSLAQVFKKHEQENPLFKKFVTAVSDFFGKM